jgi:branched-chain amino acid transport system substrate-binding protein
MTISRRGAIGTVVGAAAATAVLPAIRAGAQARPIIRVGVMNDQSGPYRDVNGPTSVICAKQAV